SMGRIYSSAGLMQTALDYCNQALLMMREEGNRVGEAGALAGIGEVYFWAGARGYVLSKPAPPSQGNMAQAVSSIWPTGGVIPYGVVSPDFPKAMKHALECFQEALDIMNAVGNRVGKIGVLTNMGLVYDSWNKPEQALDYYYKSIEVLESMRTSARLEE